MGAQAYFERRNVGRSLRFSQDIRLSRSWISGHFLLKGLHRPTCQVLDTGTRGHAESGVTIHTIRLPIISIMTFEDRSFLISRDESAPAAPSCHQRTHPIFVPCRVFRTSASRCANRSNRFLDAALRRMPKLSLRSAIYG
jgi:hypothetical protein